MFTLQKRDWQRYIPEAFGIRERFDAARAEAPDEAAKAAVLGDIELEIHGLTAEESRRYKNKVTLKVKKNREIDLGNTMEVDRELFVANARVKVPFMVGDVEISTADLLWKHAPGELVTEIKNAIEDYSALEEGRRD